MTALCPLCSHPIAPLALLVCLESSAATRFGQMVQLTPHQAAILDMLARRSPRATSIELIAMKLWGAEDGPEHEHNTIRVHVSRLRRKLAPLGVSISNRYVAGYRLVFDEVAAVRECAA